MRGAQLAFELKLPYVYVGDKETSTSIGSGPDQCLVSILSSSGATLALKKGTNAAKDLVAPMTARRIHKRVLPTPTRLPRRVTRVTSSTTRFDLVERVLVCSKMRCDLSAVPC